MKKGIAKKEGSRGSGLKPKGLFQQQQGNIVRAAHTCCQSMTLTLFPTIIFVLTNYNFNNFPNQKIQSALLKNDGYVKKKDMLYPLRLLGQVYSRDLVNYLLCLGMRVPITSTPVVLSFLIACSHFLNHQYHRTVITVLTVVLPRFLQPQHARQHAMKTWKVRANARNSSCSPTVSPPLRP